MDEDFARKIRSHAWWQGSVLPDVALRQLVGPPPPNGATHWILASQTCNLYNPDFTKIRVVEWVGATQINFDNTDPLKLSGRNPRMLHCKATGINHEDVWLECDLQLRHWIDRKLLAESRPEPFSFVDDPSSQSNLQCKDIFIRWIARSYTRLELSDELGKALRDSKIEEMIGKICKAHESEIYGIFLGIDDEDEGATAAVDVIPPCSVELFFIVNSNTQESAIRKKIDDFFGADVPNPESTAGSNSPKKIKKKDAIKRTNQLRVSYMVKDTTEWNIADLESTLRYSFVDHFSNSDEDPVE